MFTPYQPQAKNNTINYKKRLISNIEKLSNNNLWFKGNKKDIEDRFLLLNSCLDDCKRILYSDNEYDDDQHEVARLSSMIEDNINYIKFILTNYIDKNDLDNLKELPRFSVKAANI